MVVHLFGAFSSPSYSNSALRKTAEDHKHMFDPTIADTVIRNFYIDDCLNSADTVTAIMLAKGLIHICRNGGFHLTKWVSNNHAVLDSIQLEQRAKEIKCLNLDYYKHPIERALGVYWSIECDTLGFKIVIQTDRQTTHKKGNSFYR
ncbi:uncharacterized protein LOC144357870 [Saccoglossus kowalevskii]